MLAFYKKGAWKRTHAPFLFYFFLSYFNAASNAVLLSALITTRELQSGEQVPGAHEHVVP